MALSTKIKTLDLNSGKNKPLVIFIVFIVIFFFGMVVIESTFNNANAIDTNNGTDTQNLLGDNASTLTLLGNEIISLNTTANNDSWMEFDGVNDRVDISSDESLNITQNITISLWTRFYLDNPNSGTFILRTRSDSYGIDAETGGNAIISLSIVNSSGDFENSGTFTPMTNIWYHVIGRYNGTDLSLFIDGVQNQSNNYIGDFRGIGINDISIAWEGSGDRFFNGAIDEVRIYNISLTDLQITEIFSSGRLPNASLPSEGLVLWMPFSEGTGTITHDLSGENNNGV